MKSLPEAPVLKKAAEDCRTPKRVLDCPPSAVALLRRTGASPLALCLCLSLLPLLRPSVFAADSSAPPNYARVQELFNQHCLDCHASQEPEAKLVLENFESLMKGGESGPVIVAGKSSESLLVGMLEGQVEKDGKKKIMPPGKRPKLSEADIALVRSWIDAGALAPAPGSIVAQTLHVPKITPKVPPRRSIAALAYSPSEHLLAVARYGEVELLSPDSRQVVRTLTGLTSSANALVFSADGKTLYAGGGQAGLSGEVWVWSVPDGSLLRTLVGHKDAIYALALSPDGKLLATGSYDQKIKLWNTQTGQEVRTLSGHNGAIYDLAFRPDGHLLASASADRTVKLWDPSTGERRDTLAQAIKEESALVFSSDGKRLYAGGGDNRIRVWEISEKALETTNPILDARFAHEGAILKLVLSPDGTTLLSSATDGTVKLWDASTLNERLALEQQPDWAPALAFVSQGSDKMPLGIAVGRLDGTVQFYNGTSGKVLLLPKPELVSVEPRGIQRGLEAKLKLTGHHLGTLTNVVASDARLRVSLLESPAPTESEVWVSVLSSTDLPRGAYDLSVHNAQGESGKIKVYVDDLPQVYLAHGTDRTAHQALDKLPVSLWATHAHPGDAEELTVRAEAEQSLIFDVAARRLGSKAEPVLTLFDAQGTLLESNNGFDSGTDALLAYTFKAAGEYTLRISELLLGSSAEHFYRLSVGKFPYVTQCYPLSVPVGRESKVELIGFNLPAHAEIAVSPTEPGEIPLPVDEEKYRSRREFKLIASSMPELVESEPNDTPAQAMSIAPPCAVNGRIEKAGAGSDADLFRFTAKTGETWIIETTAAQRGSPMDSKIEVLHPDGKPVERLLLQAVRDSSVTFRGIDSDTTDCRVVNWEEMELNQYLYLQGEVVKLFRAPQGPDSGFLFYSSHGRRRCYFDTSPAAHALDEPCYIVEPHPPGAKLVANGLPVFPLYYANDDDGERKLGTDSKLQFKAPADGDYLIRVTDTRGLSGDRYVYRLVVRPAEPDFAVELRGAGLTLNAGSGHPFSLHAERMDGFEGAIEVTLNHLPAGYLVSTPLIIEAGHTDAEGTLYALPGAMAASAEEWGKVEVTATANVSGRAFVKALNNLGTVKLSEEPKLFVGLEPDPSTAALAVATGSNPGAALEITVAPGQSVPALLRVRRNGYDDLITFTVENLPHGVIVDNIGLNGVLIPKGQSERQIFINAAKWVPETDRLCFAIENQAGRQTSRPVLLHVRKAPVAKEVAKQ